METSGKGRLFICTMSMTETAGPAISAAVCIDEKLVLTVYMQSIQLTSLNQHRFPLKVDSLSHISKVCDELTLKNSKENSNLSQSHVDRNFIVRLYLILSLLIPLQDDSFKFCTVLKFIYEQLSLLKKTNIAFRMTFCCCRRYYTMYHHMLIDLCEAVVRSYYPATPLFEKSLCRLP